MDVDALVDLLTVEPVGSGAANPPGVGSDHFVGHSPADRDRQVYGGQFLAQALAAASATVEPDRLPHSFHAYFLRTGVARTPIDYRVERVRDGRSASHRSVVAAQGDREVFRQLASFQRPRPGPSHSGRTDRPGPGLDPSTFVDYRDWVAELSDNDHHPWFAEDLPLELRIERPPPVLPRGPMTGELRIWMRLTGPAPSDDPHLDAAILAWMSDKTISDVVLYPHGRSWTDEGSDILSLDHAMWFHEPARADQWLLMTHEAAATRRGRGLARGDLVTLDGTVVASVAQEAHIVLPDVLPD
jgi:acyl-CoA thioesterase-2